MRKWWQEVIGYQIYPASFKDTNQDGIGDLKGITTKLAYLKQLGVGLLWICPFYCSPMDDNGYDISDFYAVDPRFGSLDDFKELLKQAHELGIRVILDLVLNHSSDEHQWFKQAISSKDNSYQDYYYFKEGKVIDGVKYPPNNWKSFFSESAWTYVEEIDKYYLHIFSKKMPDLNWSNPILRKKMHEVACYWLDLGCDGFRIDAIAHLAKDSSFSDSTVNVDANGLAYDPSKFSNREEIFTYLKEMQEEVFQHYDCVTVGEVGGCASVEEGLRYVNYQNGSLNMAFNFDTCWENGAYGSIDKSDEEIYTNVVQLKQNFKRWYDGLTSKAWMPLYWLNHDHPRVVSQYGNIHYRYQSASMLAMVLLFMYGTPFIYQGEEIGMSNVDYIRLEQFQDVGAQNYFHEHKQNYSEEHIIHILKRISRCNARSPMQWSDDQYAGFSTAKPYYDVNGNYTEVNVAAQLKQDESILKAYQQLIQLRKEYLDEVLDSQLEFIHLQNPDIFAYQKGDLMVLANFRDKDCVLEQVFSHNQILFNNYDELIVQGDSITLHPYQAVLLKKKDVVDKQTIDYLYQKIKTLV